jgi:hypothetical protein
VPHSQVIRGDGLWLRADEARLLREAVSVVVPPCVDDDLVLLRFERDGVTVVGWLTRVRVPAELLDNIMVHALRDEAMQTTMVRWWGVG